MFSCNSDRLFHRGKGKGKILPKTDHEGPEGEQMYSSTLPSTSELDRGWVVSTTFRPLYPWERPGTHCTGGWVGPRAGLDGCGKSRPPPNRDSFPGPSSQERFAIPTGASLKFFYGPVQVRGPSFIHPCCKVPVPVYA